MSVQISSTSEYCTRLKKPCGTVPHHYHAAAKELVKRPKTMMTLQAWLASLNTVLFLFSPTLSTFFFFYAEGLASHSSVDPSTQYSCRVGVCPACSVCSRMWTFPDEVVLDNDDIQPIGATCANCYFNGEGHVAHHFVWRWSRSQLMRLICLSLLLQATH